MESERYRYQCVDLRDAAFVLVAFHDAQTHMLVQHCYFRSGVGVEMIGLGAMEKKVEGWGQLGSSQVVHELYAFPGEPLVENQG